MHVFADVSLCVNETVAYFRFMQEHNVKCMFIASKSKLVPLSQKPSIPCLEPQAAVIAIKSKNTIVNKILIEKGIAHRINEIRQSTDPDNSRYIKTEQNPADHISRYQDFLSLSKNDSWDPWDA